MLKGMVFHTAARITTTSAGQYVAGAAWFGHAAWDVVHHRDLSQHHAVGVVPRGYAEFCIVLDLLVGAMSVEHLLEKLTDGAVVITPGDRAEVLLELSRVAAAFTEILHGRLEHARVVLQRHATDHARDQEEVVRASVTALQVDLALAEGRIDRAGALLVAADSGGAWSHTPRARHAFYVGAYAETLRLTEDATTYPGTRPRAGLELLLLHACAAWRTGERDAAVDDLATAVGLAADTEALLPFLTVPRVDLEAIAPPGSWSREFLDEPRLVHTDTVFPEPLRAGQLSVAELRVLRELRADVPLAHIGRRLYLSESTVKTHVRRIYRKLGVSDRTHALQRARELSLLDDA